VGEHRVAGQDDPAQIEALEQARCRDNLFSLVATGLWVKTTPVVTS
jgi:hypothetical protein